MNGIAGCIAFDAVPSEERLLWHGRLDNREELQCAPPAGSDGEAVRVAFRRWGLAALPRLVGDFALAWWNPHDRHLVLARDAFGIKPLYYRVTPRTVVWSSSLTSFLFSRDFSFDIDDQYVAGYLTSTSATDETPFRDVAAVPAGGAVILDGASVRKTIYWSAAPGDEIRLRNDAEYEERFRELFTTAVRTRLKSDGGVVAAELSGGLDSSSIVCVADTIRPGLHTISHVYDEARSSDERPFIEQVETQRGRRGHHVLEDRHRILRTLEEDDPFLDFPTPFSLAAEQYAEVRRVMRELNARVLLSGSGGDQLLWGEVGMPVMLADALVGQGPRKLHRDLVAWSHALETSYLQLVWDGVVTPLLPSRLQARLAPYGRIPPWIDGAFARRTRFHERLLGWPGQSRFRLRAQREEYNSLQNAIWIASRAHAIERGAFELRFPFLHRPLVEFALALPLEQKLRPGETRSILRRALRDVLPREIATRTTKRGPDEAIHRAVAREGARLEEIVRTARVCERGYVKKEELRAALQRMRHGVNVSTPAFIRILSLELWLRALERVPALRHARPPHPVIDLASRSERLVPGRPRAARGARAVVSGSETQRRRIDSW